MPREARIRTFSLLRKVASRPLGPASSSSTAAGFLLAFASGSAAALRLPISSVSSENLHVNSGPPSGD